MPIEASELVVAANGQIDLAAYGTALPVDIDEALNAAFVDAGLATEDGVKFSVNRTVVDKKAWQAFEAVRKIVTGRDSMASFVLEQWNRHNVPLAFGGGSVATTANGFKYDPPDPEDLDERSAVISWADDDKNYRLVIRKCIVVDNVETNLTRTDTSDLPITLGILGVDGTTPWYILTDDPNFGAAGSPSQ